MHASPRPLNELLGSLGSGVRVGIVGSGFDRTLHDPRVLPGAGFVDPSDELALLQTSDDHDRLGQGTACAYLVLAIAPDARVVPLRIFGGDDETSPNVFQAALLWALEQKLDVVCITAGTQVEATLHPMYAACEKARRSGTVLVAAGHPENDWSYPSIFENVIGVSSGRFPTPFDYRYHPDHACECEAPGEDQAVRWLGGEKVTVSGTMYAAANLAGIVALLRERHPGAPLEQIRELLRRLAP